MPITVNGIGTRYHGKKNGSVRDGICRSCQKPSRLESYDTRLWVVIVFIPVIPLQRKRILDYCHRCSRHYAVGIEQWETQRQLSVSSAKDKYRQSPSPESALEAHGAMLGFHDYDGAASFREEARQSFGTSATLNVGLAAQLDQVGLYAQATPFYEQALAQSPDIPEARVGLALRRIHEGKYAEARQLLDHLFQPGALRIFSAGPLDQLMTALQKAGKHEEALEIARHVQTELPDVSRQRTFRKFVEKSETALGNRDSILPTVDFAWKDVVDWNSGRYSKAQRWGVILAACFLIILSGLAVQNEYRRQHRRIDVVNAMAQPVSVAVDGGTPVDVKVNGSLPIAEGKHHVRITGGVDEEFDVNLHSGYFERWTHSPRWLINPGGAAAFRSMRVHYASNPRPAETRLIVGERFLAFPHVDYLFEDPPASMTVDSHQSEVVKQAVGMVYGPAADTFRESFEAGDGAKSLTFAESALLRKPDDADLADLYTGAALKLKQGNRARDFLKRKLGDRPVCIPWHRAYQSVEEFAGNMKALEDEYDKAVKKEPANAALLYLDGRVVTDHKQAEELFRQASRIDPALPWSWYALAYDEAGRGDWKSCLDMLSHIPNVEKFSQSAADLYYHARLGSGQAAQLEAEYRKKLERTAAFETLPELTKLIDAQMSQGKAAAAKVSVSNWENRLPAALRNHEAMNSLVRPVIWYYLGDFARIKNALPAATLRASPFLIEVLLATGDTDALLKRNDLEKLAEGNAEFALDLSIAFELAKNPKAAQTWCQMAADQFDHLYARYRRAAEMLRSNSPPKFDEFTALNLDVSTKVRMATLLALRFPEQKETFAKLARQLNVSRQPPFYLVQRALK